MWIGFVVGFLFFNRRHSKIALSVRSQTTYKFVVAKFNWKWKIKYEEWRTFTVVLKLMYFSFCFDDIFVVEFEHFTAVEMANVSNSENETHFNQCARNELQNIF